MASATRRPQTSDKSAAWWRVALVSGWPARDNKVAVKNSASTANLVICLADLPCRLGCHLANAQLVTPVSWLARQGGLGERGSSWGDWNGQGELLQATMRGRTHRPGGMAPYYCSCYTACHIAQRSVCPAGGRMCGATFCTMSVSPSLSGVHTYPSLSPIPFKRLCVNTGEGGRPAAL
jgi:hypothetical protein